MADTRLALDDGSLVDLLDRLLDTGVALDGSVLITLAQVDLIRLDLRLLLASVQTLVEGGPPDRPRHRQQGLRDPDGRPSQPAVCREERSARPPAAQDGRRAGSPGPGPRAADRHLPDHRAAAAPARPLEDASADPAGGLAGLVIAVVDIVRQLLERQALRRMDAGALTAEQVERLGQALIALQRQVRQLSDLLGARRPATATRTHDHHGRDGHHDRPSRLDHANPSNWPGWSVAAARTAAEGAI